MISWKKWAGLAALLVLLSACSAKTPTASLEATDVPTTVSEPVSTPEPTPTVVAVDYCVACHLDKDELIRTAKPEEEGGEAESEGKG
jgi:hypothetical protein